MLKCSLPFAVVIKAELIHGAVIERPSMRYVPLLDTLIQVTSKTRNVGTNQLKIREWLQNAAVIKIVVDAKVLFVIQFMVELYRKLIAAYRFGGNGSDQRAAIWRSGNKLQQINRCGIHASQRNLATRKYTRIRRSIRDRSASNSSCGCLAPRTIG